MKPWGSVSAVIAGLLLFVLGCGGAEPTATALPTPVPPTSAAVPTSTTGQVPATSTVAAATATRAAPTATPTRLAASPTVTPVKPTAGGVLRTTLSRNLELNDFHASRQATTWVFMAPQLSWLVANSEGGPGVLPDLAERWEIGSDGLTYTFHLAKNATWSDGKPVTADDVIYNIDRISGKLDLKTPIYKSTMDLVASTEKVDSSTVKIKLSQVSASFVPGLGVIGNMFYPKHVPISEFQAVRPVGSGPYVFESYAPDIKITLKKNPKYWKTDELGSQLPYLDGIAIFIVGDLAASRAAYRTGQIDVTFPFASPFLGFRDTVLKDVKGTRFISFYVNRGILFRNLPPFDDVKIRRAINLASDRQDFASIYYPGESEPYALFSIVGSSWGTTREEIKKLPGYNPDTRQQDIQTAKQLLNEFLQSHNLTLDTFKPTLTTLDIYQNFGEIFQAQMKKNLGLDIKLKVLDRPTSVQIQAQGSFEMYGGGGTPGGGASTDPSQALTPFYKTGSGLNYGGIADPAIDKALDDLEAILDPAKRAERARALERQLYELSWHVVHVGDPQSIAVRPEVRGYERLHQQDNYASQYERTWLVK